MDSLIYESGLFIPEPACKIELEPCVICKRTFVPATLEKHIGICHKMQMRKRAVFDSSQMRREGTELEKYIPPPPVHTSPAGLHKWLDSRVSPPRQTTKLTKKVLETKSPSTQSLGRQGRSNSSISTSTIGDFVRKRSTKTEPVSNQCPYCERNFGLRAFDRHVEWCKEKAILKSHGAEPAKDQLGKERLKARINYRAPSLRSKRETTREKYSPFDDSFMKHFVHNKNKCFSESGRSLSNSIASSVISDGGFHDKYDPFMSAKRQLEELFYPSHEKSPIAPINSPNMNKVPLGAISRIKHSSSPAESNFRRSMSLRLPKTTSSKTLPKTKVKPSSVQSGLTEDGPISSSFLKPEQYDELPVRSVFSSHSTNVGLSPTPAILRDPETIPNRKKPRFNRPKNSLPSLEFPILKTDSLAAFLNYEKNLEGSLFSEKDLKDTNNILTKQPKMKSVLEDFTDDDDDDGVDDEKVIEEEVVQEEALNDNKDQRDTIKPTVLLNDPQKRYMKVILSPILVNKENKPVKFPVPDNYIDPKLINDCDNLDTSNSSINTLRDLDEPELFPRLSQSNSEKKLKRQMKLQLDNILYDTTPASSEEGTAADPDCGTSTKLQPAFGKPLEKYFDDFDLDEFINSFEDDEENPIFKGYKEMLQNNSSNKLDGDSDPEQHEEEDEQNSLSSPLKFQLDKLKQQPTHTELVGTDSSYGSLTRQSTPEKRAPSPKRRDGKPRKLVRFCYECGNEFIAEAKFCIECGVKRVILED